MSDTPETAAIRERLAAITPGEWHAGRADMQSYDAYTGEAFTNVYADNPEGKWVSGHHLPFTVARAFDESGRNKADAEFIAHAPSDIAHLLEDNANLLTLAREIGEARDRVAAELASSRAALSEAEERIKALEAENKALKALTASSMDSVDVLTAKAVQQGKMLTMVEASEAARMEHIRELEAYADTLQGEVDKLESWQRGVLELLALGGEDRGPLMADCADGRIKELLGYERYLELKREAQRAPSPEGDPQ